MLSLDPLPFISALVLLLAPLTLLHPANTRYRLMDRHWFSALPRAVLFPWHWVDVLRAGFAYQLLRDAFSLPPYNWIPAAATTLLAQGAILLLAVVVHTLVFKNRNYAHAPFALIIGVLFALLPPLLSALGLLVAFTIASGLRVAAAFFFVLPLALFGFGLWLYPDALHLRLGVLTAVCWLAPLLAMLFNRRLVFANRPTAESHDHSLARDATPTLAVTADK